MRITKILTACVLAVVFALSLHAQKYPKPTGFVNDWANLLPSETEQVLEEKLRDYEKQTTIEIAVVITPSLDGEPVENYSMELAEEWGIGKKGKDNGLLFLVAPNERKLRIEIGYGLESDLPDSKAGRVRDEAIIPHFTTARTAKESGDTETYTREMIAGVLGGVDGIIGALGTKTMAQRQEERKLEEEKRQRELAARWEAAKSLFFGLVILLAIGIPLILIVRVVLKVRRRLAELRELYDKNGRVVDDLSRDMSTVENSEYPAAKLTLVKILKENPRAVWKDVKPFLDAVPAQLEKAKKQHGQLSTLHSLGPKKAEATRNYISSVSEPISSCRESCHAVGKLAGEIATARDRSPKLIGLFEESVKKLEEGARHPDVLTDIGSQIRNARAKYDEAQNLSRSESPNWLLVFAAISAAAELIFGATKIVKDDIVRVSAARSKIPPLTKEMPGSIAKAEKAVSDSDVSSEAKGLVEKAKAKYKEAGKVADQSPSGLVATFALLAAAAGFLEEATRRAANDIEEEARRRRRRRQSSYSSSSSYGGGYSSGGSSFGGFGGGSFGGGGVSGSW